MSELALLAAKAALVLSTAFSSGQATTPVWTTTNVPHAEVVVPARPVRHAMDGALD